MASKLTLLPFVCVLLFLSPLINGKFDNDTIKRLQGCQRGSKVQGLHYLKLYLAHFGYFNYEHPDSQNVEFDLELEAAVKSYQNFYNLNASGILDGPTISQMIKPRCGHPDKKSSHKHKTKLLHIVSHYTFFSGNPTWPRSQLTYAFGSNYPNAYVPPVVSAFNTWASASGYFTFSQVDDVTSADLKISFETGDHGDGGFGDNIVAHAFPPQDGRFHYNADYTWSVGPAPNTYDLETTALHEIGHLLGLDHSTIEEAIMWSVIPEGNAKGLNQDDIQGIRALYGVN